MLDPWIVEQIIRREEDRRRRQEETRVELPLESPRYHEGDSSKPASEDSERGVTIIDL